MQKLENQNNPITCLVIDTKQGRKEKWRTILGNTFAMFFWADSIDTIEELPKGSKLPKQVDVVFIHKTDEGVWEEFSQGENPKTQAKFEFVFNTPGNPTVTGKQRSITKPNGDKDLSITEGDINQVIDYIKDPRSDNLPNMCKLEKNCDYYWNELGNRDIIEDKDKKREVQEIFEFIVPPKKKE